MSAENKIIARRYGEDFWGRGDLQAAAELFAPDVIDHCPLPGQAPGLEGQRQVVSMFRNAFPDLRVTADDIVAEADRVVLRWTGHGTHRGELMGIAPTGRQVRITGIDILRVGGGRIVERWGEDNAFSLMQQLGVIPGSGQAAS
jgi:predicted ester cyclase